MMMPIMLLLSVSNIHGQGNDFQVMTGPVFQDFARLADARCPSRRLRFLTPGDLDDQEERFEARLSAAARQRLAGVYRKSEGCANRDGGLSCDAQHKLAAMKKLDLLPAFTGFACAAAG